MDSLMVVVPRQLGLIASIQGPFPAGASCGWRSQFPPSPNRCWWCGWPLHEALLFGGHAVQSRLVLLILLRRTSTFWRKRRSRTRRTLEPSLFCLHSWMLLNILIDPWLQEVVSWTYPKKLYKTVSMMALYNEHPGKSCSSTKVQIRPLSLTSMTTGHVGEMLWSRWQPHIGVKSQPIPAPNFPTIQPYNIL